MTASSSARCGRATSIPRVESGSIAPSLTRRPTMARPCHLHRSPGPGHSQALAADRPGRLPLPAPRGRGGAQGRPACGTEEQGSNPPSGTARTPSARDPVAGMIRPAIAGRLNTRRTGHSPSPALGDPGGGPHRGPADRAPGVEEGPPVASAPAPPLRSDPHPSRVRTGRGPRGARSLVASGHRGPCRARPGQGLGGDGEDRVIAMNVSVH